jgi:glycerol-3-phosphate dehydrogenase
LALPEPAPQPTAHSQILIIGAGVIGLSIARLLSRFSLSVLVVDRANDVSQGATKANSGIVHAGYDDKPGSVKASVCFKGNQMFDRLESELEMGFRRVGSYVLAYSDADIDGLKEVGSRFPLVCRHFVETEIRRLLI